MRQDYLIAQGLLSPFESEDSDTSPMTELALARLRQLSAHEVGHTLGISHNFASSMQNRASVMDYPHPLVGLNSNGSIDLSNAYDTGIGEWDKVASAYGYSEFGEDAHEKIALDRMLQASIDEGLAFISDQDARPAGGAHPDAHLWDNGTDASDELVRILGVRENALRRFSENSIPVGTPFSQLADVLAPLFLSHRYQVDAASKLLGGLYYTYAVRGDGQTIAEIVSPERQRKALDALLLAISPASLTLPESILKLLPPPAFAQSRGRESFETRTGVTFDPLAIAETAASFTAEFLLHPERAARLIEYHARDESNPSLDEVLRKTLDSTWKGDAGKGLSREVGQVVDTAVLKSLIQLAGARNASTQVKASATYHLQQLEDWLSQQAQRERAVSRKAHLAYGAARIKRFLEQPEDFEVPNSLRPPAGSPIGMACVCGSDWLH